LSDEKRLHEMSKLARYEAQARFCTTRIIPQYEDFYRKVLERAS
jgi:L-malate glycosyltransferase